MPGWHSGSDAGLEAPTLVPGFDDPVTVDATVEERGCHFGVSAGEGSSWAMRVTLVAGVALF